MIYQPQNDQEDDGAHLFRDVEEIRARIVETRAELYRVNQAFNVRKLLVDLIYEEERTPEKTAEQIANLFSEAKSTSEKLHVLLSDLEELKSELSTVKEAIFGSV